MILELINLSDASGFHHMSHNPIIRLLPASLTAFIFIASRASILQLCVVIAGSAFVRIQPPTNDICCTANYVYRRI